MNRRKTQQNNGLFHSGKSSKKSLTWKSILNGQPWLTFRRKVVGVCVGVCVGVGVGVGNIGDILDVNKQPK